MVWMIIIFASLHNAAESLIIVSFAPVWHVTIWRYSFRWAQPRNYGLSGHGFVDPYLRVRLSPSGLAPNVYPSVPLPGLS
jgi:hypothetical protein